MTPEEFAAQTGLSVEEATLILHRRQAASEPVDARVIRARSILALAQKKVGVHPVDESLTKVYDPDADVGLSEFYKNKTQGTQRKFRSEVDGSWDEFDQSGKDSE